MPRARNGHGGTRAGRPGGQYAQRSDLASAPRTAPAQPVRVAPGGTYGTGVQQQQAQQAVPLPDFSALALHRPTDRPQEPVTAGVPVGPGPGPEALSQPITPPPQTSSVLDQLQAAYSMDPTNDLRTLIEQLQAQGGM